MAYPSAAELREAFSYDPETGELRQKRAWRGLAAGRLVKTRLRSGYKVCCYNRKTYRQHRVAWCLMTGNWPRGEIDHINHKRDDNRWSNLREVSRQENARNLSVSSLGVSGFRGVRWVEPNKKWRAYIYSQRRHIHLGMFAEKSAAIEARKAAEVKLGFHSNHGEGK